MTWLGWIFALTFSPAQAAAHPNFLPDHDILATYDLSVPGRPDAPYQLQYDAADQRARIIDPLRGLAFLVDLQAGHAELIVPALHAVVEAPDISNLARQVENADGARFTPLGPGRYAGLACDKYLVLTAQATATACITPDGVILHFSGRDPHGTATLTATSVAYTTQPRADFVQPYGYSAITLPPGALAQLLGQ